MDTQVKVSDRDLDKVKLRFNYQGLTKDFTLKRFVGRPNRDGWRVLHVNARDTAVYRSYVDAIKFIVSDRANVTVGHTKICKFSAPDQVPADFITEDGDCSLLDGGK